MIVTPGSQEVLARCVEDGLMDIFCEAGAMVGPPGCGPCAIGKGGPLADGETCIATVTRNDVGRMGAVRRKSTSPARPRWPLPP